MANDHVHETFRGILTSFSTKSTTMTKEKIDLGAAFEKLKDKNRNYPMLLEGLVKAQEIVDSGADDLGNAFAQSSGFLSGTIKAFLIIEGGMKFSDIDLSPLPTKEKQGDPSL